MREIATAAIEAHQRRHERVAVNLLARIHLGAARSTVLLSDLTTHGARVETPEGFQNDEAIKLTLPGLAPRLAFVAWSDGHAAGVEFADPLENAAFEQIIAHFALGTASAPACAA